MTYQTSKQDRFHCLSPMVGLTKARPNYSIEKLAYIYPYCWTRLSGHTSYCFIVSACVAFWNLTPQLKIVIPSIALFIERSGIVHSMFSYSLLGVPNRSALDFNLCLLWLKFPRSFLYQLCWKFLLLCWHRTFYPPL